ncbi:hypothetical protein KIF24_13255 [Micromonospora sp. Llam7]|uniref:hypothetical protein n=1 Tax=Micromonospora tarapacensis TaxID=2835305 RepID=UPI001C833B38|nr:hypothetical protein [Micromonospora tarapacensis]MBX7266897.1 hypothetical protein [Micromonospora tarapacensis]
MTHGQDWPIHDAVHGVMDFHDPALFGRRDLLQLLLESPQLQRLRRLHQLPFGEHAFLSSTHNRFGHAVGTAHIALRLLQRLRRNDFFDPTTLTALREALPRLAVDDDAAFVRSVGEHVVLAGLLQDVGELPHKPALGLFLYPHATLAARVAADLDVSTHGMSDKELFTLHGVIELFQAHEPLRAGLDIGVLAYLIAGKAAPEIQVNPALSAVRQIVDGVVDADRLDYVHRDSHHSIASGMSSASHVVDTLITYDEHGPIFDSTGPVANFLMLRAVLRSQVYSAPAVRFRVTLLAVVMSELLRRHPDWMATYFDARYGALSGDAFHRLDDTSLFANLRRLRADREAEVLDLHVTRAADVLLSGETPYEYHWLDRPATAESPAPVTLRPDIFVDGYWDYETHRLYRPGSVRVCGAPHAAPTETVALERTAGHVSEFLQMMWDAPPVQNNVLFFVPPHRIDWFRATLARGPAERRGLYQAAITRDAEVRLSVVDDTRDESTHTGPAIFVSFCWEDIDSMRAVLRLLYERRRRYYAFVEDYHGLGGNTRQNGSRYAAQADAALILLSPAYTERAADPKGNIYPELIALGRQLPAQRIVPVSLDAKADYRDKLDRFPWALLGYEEAPFLGAPIRNATTSQIARALDTALRVLDEAWERRADTTRR